MTTTRADAESLSKLDKKTYPEQINKIIETITPQFYQIVRSYVTFNMLFLAAAVTEFVLLLFFFTFLVHSSILAFTLAIIFLTLFSYFILRVYFLTRKPEQFLDLRNRYMATCQNLINYREGIPDHHVTLANACYLFAAALQGKESYLYTPPHRFASFTPWLEKFSSWWHWHDFHRMKELLLQSSVNENIQLVKCEPTNLEAHYALANAYVMLSGLYVDPRKIEGYEDDERWMPTKQFMEVMQQKFRATAERAIEEFKILNDYAPNDPWVHAQLAYSYRDLQMPLEEIKEYETILKLIPNDKETLYKLGVLYFQQGMNAHGLRVYEELKETHYKKAESLISHYGNAY